MPIGREFKTCFISLLLLISSLSVFVFTPETAKAESIGTTTIYFHDVPIEDVLDDEVLDLILYFDYFNEERFQEILDKIEELEEKLLNESLTEEEIKEINAELDELYESLLEESFRLNLGYLIDQNLPSKTNDSEYPPTFNKIINLLLQGDLKNIISSLLTGEELSEEAVTGFEDLIENILSSLASFRGFYVYNGDETVSLNGEVTFSLYFSSPINYIVDKDIANVSLSVFGLDQSEEFLEVKFTKSENVEIQRQLLSPFKNPVRYEIPIMVTTDLDPGDIIMVDIDIAAEEKRSLDYIDDYIDFNISQWGLNETLEEFAEILNSTGIEFLVNLSEMLLNISEFLEEGGNFTDLNLTEILEEMTSSFIYDSISHPSSLTLPFSTSGEDNENIKRYYLHDGDLMDENLPVNDGASEALVSKSSARWDGPNLERSKILKAATANLYLEYQDLIRLGNILKGKIKVTVTLFDGEKEIDSYEVVLNRTTLLSLLMKSNEPKIFRFSDLNYEIDYGSSLSLEVSASAGSSFGLSRYVKILYDSTDYPSSLTVKFDETDHIRVNVVVEPSNEKVALGGSVKYNLTITSDFEEKEVEITISGFSTEEKGVWDIDIVPESFSIPEGGQETVNIVVMSTDTDLDEEEVKAAYERGDILNVTFIVAGKTGKTMLDAEVEVSKDAVEYDIIVVDPPDQKIKHGENGTYHFKIKNNNTGFLPDSYTVEVSSENKWNLSYDRDIEELAFGDEVKINVTISVPKDTDVPSDVLTFTVTSDENKDTSVPVTVTTTVIGPSILEILYGFFESSAEDFGLDEIFGSSYLGAIFLAAMVFIIMLLIIIVLVYFLTIKYVNVVCLERIKEISPDEEARFEITVQNPYKYKLSYEISAEEASSSPGWDVSLDAESIVLEPKQSKMVILTVKPTSFVKPNDWTEVKVAAKVLDKYKSAKISTVTTIKDANVELRIYGVFHWPRIFKKGDRVTTSFKLENNGNASASNISVILYVNDEEKNKVEDITIPSGGYADIEMPWIAVKGKNEVDIVVK